MGDIFWVSKISNMFLGCMKILIYFFFFFFFGGGGVNGRCWARAYVCRKKYPLPLGHIFAVLFETTSHCF